MGNERRMIPVWFFVGVLLLVYGVLILADGIINWNHLPHTVLANLHSNVWWGALLIVIGGVFVQLFRPRKSSK